MVSVRLDHAVMERFHFASQIEAQKVILAGKVYSAKGKLDKPGVSVQVDEEIFLKDCRKDFVSRGGEKLKGALDAFSLNVQGKIAVDVGISTGGFTDCLLQNGVSRVYGFDVGYGMVDWAVRNNPLLTLFERTNFRKLTEGEIKALDIHADIVVMDVSFISATSMTKNLLSLFGSERKEESLFFLNQINTERRKAFLDEFGIDAGFFSLNIPETLRGVLITLVKPQFELCKEKIEKGGIVRKRENQTESIVRVLRNFQENGLAQLDIVPSPITGAKGNSEFLLLSAL